MGHRRIHRKQFPCGHKGQGQTCQQCKQEQAQAEQKAGAAQNRQRERQEWNNRFHNDPIDLQGLPKRIVKKARHIINALENGTPYQQLGGVRFQHNRQIIRIPVTFRYRMLCDEVNGRIVPRVVISHASYDHIAKNTKR